MNPCIHVILTFVSINTFFDSIITMFGYSVVLTAELNASVYTRIFGLLHAFNFL